MPDEAHPIWYTLDCDQINAAESRKLLESVGLMAPLEEVSSLFNSLPREVEADLRSSGVDPFARADDSGDFVDTFDFLLRILMLQSAGMQFLHAVGHLLRGHSLELFGHARTMIENAGIAYLSKAEPDLGEVYIRRQSEYRSRTTSAKILPTADPLTAELNEAFSKASEMFHSNFISVAARIRTQFHENDGKRDFSNEMKFHDIDADDPKFFLQNAGWLVRQSGRVLRLFAAAFGLPDCVWYRRLERFEQESMATLERLRPQLFPKGGAAGGP